MIKNFIFYIVIGIMAAGLSIRCYAYNDLDYQCEAHSQDVPQDSVGIFAIHKSEVVRMNRIGYSKIKGTGALAAALTFGLSEVKAKYEYNYKTSPNKFKGEAKFRLYFGTPKPEQLANLYMFTLGYTAQNIEIARFEVEKNKRLLTGASASIFGAEVGVSGADGLLITERRLRPNVYELTVTGEPGEYCIVFSFNGTGVYNGVFDFTIEK